MAKRSEGSDAAQHEDKNPIIRRWEKLAAAKCEIDVGFELQWLADTIPCDDDVQRTHFPSGLSVPTRFELLRAEIRTTIVRWNPEENRLGRINAEVVVASLKPIGEPF